METISNSVLTVQIAEHGAELQSIRKDGKEYLWQGDAKFWGRRSPILFPTVGRVWDNKYWHAGNTYEIGQHGFARDMDFKVTHKEDQGIVYWLESTPDTLGKFPFPFRLLVGYLLEDNQIIVKWRVENLGAMDMYFQIGAHPAFYFPGFDASENERGFFTFNRTSDLEYIVPMEKGCVSPERHTLKLNKEKMMPIDIYTFDCDTYIFDNKQLKKVTLLDKEKKPYVSLEFDSPLVALWSPTKAHPDCPFVCIEPWYGRCDSIGYTGEWKDREWMQKLAPKEVFDVAYKIIIE
ncbi:aldose 1-epimerase family protein [Phocaeicola sp.]|uniref:aldose 1-epimerase family protein n=1 Tax=Phocaeicola sp. TaxID=2773926 RepID=UPI0023C2F427|nr:aldose 1-epimerase family protein [Phocaeicola sp.]MDE5676336.1 aldose 1-epimerase family protein [Phocaeicola sp.]